MSLVQSLVYVNVVTLRVAAYAQCTCTGLVRCKINTNLLEGHKGVEKWAYKQHIREMDHAYFTTLVL